MATYTTIINHATRQGRMRTPHLPDFRRTNKILKIREGEVIDALNLPRVYQA